MKTFLFLFSLSVMTSACSTADKSRMPSSMADSGTTLGKGARITLKQPVPFINTESSRQTVKVTSRRSFAYAGSKYFCTLSTQVPKQDTFFFEEGTTFEFKEQNGTGSNNLFSPRKGGPVNLSCFNQITGEQKRALTLEEAQAAFPKDVLVIEQSEPTKNADLKDELVRH